MIKLFKKLFGLCQHKGCYNSGNVEVTGKRTGLYCMKHYKRSGKRSGRAKENNN